MLTEFFPNVDRWCKDHLWCDKDGNPANRTEPYSCCLIGALVLETKEMWGKAWNAEIDKLYAIVTKNPEWALRCFSGRYNTRTHQTWLAHFNNHPHTTFEDILKVCEQYDALDAPVEVVPEQRKELCEV